MNEDKLFIVAVGEGLYARDAAGVKTTDVPSRALQMNYLDANALAQRLRDKYENACVADVFGFEITHEAIKRAIEGVVAETIEEYTSGRK